MPAVETLFDAMKRVRNPLAMLLLRQIVTSDELFSVISFVPKGGDAFMYTREKDIGAFNFVSDTHATVGKSTAADEVVTVEKREAVEDYYVRNAAMSSFGGSGGMNPLARQRKAKAKVAGRKIATTIISGANNTGFSIEAFQSGPYVDAIVESSGNLDSVRRGPGLIKYTHAGTLVQFQAPGDTRPGPQVAAAADGTYLLVSDNPSKWIRVTLDVSDATANATRTIEFTSTSFEFDGLLKLIAPGQIREATGADGDLASLAILDQLIDAVKYRENLAFVMHSRMRQRYEDIFRGLGWGVPTVKLPNSARDVTAYKNIPMLTCDNMPINETKGSGTGLSSIILVNLSPEEGFYVGAFGGETIEVEADPRDRPVLGFQIYPLGQSQEGPSSVGERMAWYGGCALGSDLAAARARHISLSAS